MPPCRGNNNSVLLRRGGRNGPPEPNPDAEPACIPGVRAGHATSGGRRPWWSLGGRRRRRSIAPRSASSWKRNSRRIESNVGISGVASRRSVGRSFEFAAKLADRGWLTPHWPAEYGGADATAWEHIILGEEMWSRGEPRGPQYMNVNWIGPAIMAAGTAEQQEYHLKRISAGDVIWCQGFSEPDAGSDLASLNTTAIRDGDEYVVNGQKIWTSYANSGRILLPARAHRPQGGEASWDLDPPDAHRHAWAGDPRHSRHVGEHAFHQHVLHRHAGPGVIPAGPENEGWAVVRRALSYERVGSPRYARAAFMLDEIARWAHAHGKLSDPAVAERLVLAKARCEAARLLAYCVIDDRNKQRPPGPNAYVARVAMVQADRAVGELALEIMGSEGLAANSLADEQFRSALPAGVAAGTIEVQLNLVSRAVLGLPRS